MRKRYFFILASLLISLFIYLFYRTEKTVVNELLIQLISMQSYSALREEVNGFLPLNELIIYSLPEGLWVFCITLTSRSFYLQLLNRQIQGVLVPLVFCIGMEMLQLLNFTKGRFDFMDIWLSLLCWIIANYFFEHGPEKQNILKPLNRRSILCFGSYGIVYLAHVLE